MRQPLRQPRQRSSAKTLKPFKSLVGRRTTLTASRSLRGVGLALALALGAFGAVGTLATVLLSPAAAYAATNLYRYLNAEGHFEISNTIPPDRVALGYERLDSRSGRVLEVIEPQKSQAEVDRINREARARNACQTALDRVNSLYQSELDIDSAEEQALKSLSIRIENAEHNLRQAQEQKRDFESTAAQLERAGKSLDARLVNNIDRAEAQVDNLQSEIEQRHREQEQARERFARDLALFKQATCADEAALGFIDMAKADSSDS